MDLLTIRHQDFTMYVECTKFDGIWNKAARNVGEDSAISNEDEALAEMDSYETD